MSHGFSTLLSLTVALALGAFAPAQSPKPAAATQPAAGPATSQADEYFAPIARDIKNLFESLRNKGTVDERDQAIIREMRDRVAEFSRKFPKDVRGPAAQLTLSTWLKEDDLVDKLYADILKLTPDKTDIRLAWVDRLKAKDRYDDAINVLKDKSVDPVKFPLVMTALSDLYFATNRFQEAVDALKSIPQSVIDEQLMVKAEVDKSLKPREEMLALWQTEQSLRAAEKAGNDLPRVTLKTAKGVISLELFENEAANTVANFINLAERGFYDGTKFHRVEPKFVIQGGDPNSKDGAPAGSIAGQGNPGYFIANESGQENHRNHFAGSLAMARTDALDSAGSQFYITLEPTPILDGKYTVFGRVLDGMDVVRQIQPSDVIESVKVTRKRSHPYEPVKLPLPGASTRPAATAPSLTPAVPADPFGSPETPGE